MVVMALVTTFMTTPIVIWLYPEWYQKQTAERYSRDNGDSIFDDQGLSEQKDPSIFATSRLAEPENYFSLVTMLNRIDTVPSMMALIRLLKQDSAAASTSTTSEKKFSKDRLDIHALRLLELTQRSSDVMRIQDLRETTRQDPVLNVLRTFTSLIGIESLQTRLDFRTPSEFISTVADYGESVSADMILLPWVTRTSYQAPQQQQQEINPMDQQASSSDALGVYQVSDADFASSAYSITKCTVGLFIDRGFGHVQDGNLKLQQSNFQIIVPFTNGGSDDRAALIFALRLQMYNQADVLVLKPASADSSILYASSESIQNTLNTMNATQCTDDELLNTLFASHVASNVVLRSIHQQQQTEFSNILDHLEKPLDKHDLVVLGRSIAVKSNTTVAQYTPTPLEAGYTAPYSRGFKSALGNQAYQILSAGTLASIVVIQAPVDHTVTDV